MAKLDLSNLQKLRKEKQQDLAKQATKTQILVGMGTCGIAAGAKKVWNAFEQELKNNNLNEVILKQSGCMGNCGVEPIVEIKSPNMPDVIYGNVDPDIARKIINKHIINQQLLNGLIQDRPAQDILTN